MALFNYVTKHGDYEKAVRVSKELKFVSIGGNSNTRYVEFTDEDGNTLTWTTNDYTKGYKALVKKGLYNFKVDYIVKQDDEKVRVNITHVSLQMQVI